MKYVASFSGGKDSTATIILAHENNIPIDEIIFAEVMFDKNISGELPEHINFIKQKCIPIFESWGYKTTILHSDKTYMDCFNHIVTRSKTLERNGKKSGFPMAGRCMINRDCKMRAINKYFKDNKDVIQYIGIAIDEPRRLAKLDDKHISLLERYGYTEKMAYDLCEKYDLLSPSYEFSTRGGCWFCPNAKMDEIKHLMNYHPELWKKLIELEHTDNIIGYCWNTLTKTYITDLDKRLKESEAEE